MLSLVFWTTAAQPPQRYLAVAMCGKQFGTNNSCVGSSLAVEWLGLGALIAGALGLTPRRGTKIP